VAGLLDRDGVIALGILLSSRLSRLGVYTVSEMLENRYGATSRLISTIIAVTSTIAIGTVFNVVLSLSRPAWRYWWPEASSLPTRWPAACGR
jgi:hypothetical protein